MSDLDASEPWCRDEGCMHALHGEDVAPVRQPQMDARIEAVAKLLFTGPLFAHTEEQWQPGLYEEDRADCFFAAEDILRGIDAVTAIETAETQESAS